MKSVSSSPAELVLSDNSADADPAAGDPPRPTRILHGRDGAILDLAPPAAVPEWAKAPVAMALATWSARERERARQRRGRDQA